MAAVLGSGTEPTKPNDAGMDALTHAVEAYLSTASTPVTDACALQAIRIISAYLRDAVSEPDNMRARDMMAYAGSKALHRARLLCRVGCNLVLVPPDAEFLAGMAFNSASLGYVHAMAHQLGGVYGLPHGVCNAVLLPVVAEYNSQAAPQLFIDIAEAMGFRDVGRFYSSPPCICSHVCCCCRTANWPPPFRAHDAANEPDRAIGAVLREIRQLGRDIGIPRNLQELGVKPDDFDRLARGAEKDACGLTNPRRAQDTNEFAELFKRAFDQQ